MKTAVEFKSDLFKPFLPDDCQVNPGVYGAELAYWLARRLSEEGIPTSYPLSEDWGWFIEFSLESGEEYSFCCGNVTGGDSEWRCFLQPQKKFPFGRKPEVDKASRLLETVARILQSTDGIRDVRWCEE